MTDIKLGNYISKTFNTTSATVQDSTSSYYTEEYDLVSTGDFRQVSIDFRFVKPSEYSDKFQILANNNIIYDTNTYIASPSGNTFDLTTFPGVTYKIRFLQNVLGKSSASLQYNLSLQDKGIAKSISNDENEITTINTEGRRFRVARTSYANSLQDIALSPNGKLYGVRDNNKIVRIDPGSPAPAVIGDQSTLIGVLVDGNNLSVQNIRTIEFAKDGKLYVVGTNDVDFGLHLYRVDNIESKAATLVGNLPTDLNTDYFASSTKASNYTLDVANSRLLTISGDTLWQVPLSNPSSASKIGDGIGIGNILSPIKSLIFEDGNLIAYNTTSGGDIIQRIKIDVTTGKGVKDGSISSNLTFTGRNDTSIIPASLLNPTPPVLPNRAPTLVSPIADTAAPINSPFNFTVPINTFIDPDVGDKLTYKATLDNGNPLPTWLKFDANTITFSGTPNTSDVNNLSVKVTASDPQKLEVSDTFKIDVVKSAISIKGVQFSEQSVNKSFGVRNNINQTVDGNIVSIEATIENLGDVAKTINVSAKDTAQGLSIGKKTITVAARSTVTTKIDWDTNGYAWNAGKPSNREILISTEDTSSSGNNPISVSQNIKVIPKPVILVHGLNSSADVFNNYVDFLKSTNPEWKGVKAEKIDTGILTPDLKKGEILDTTISSIVSNAKQLSVDIEAERYRLNAQRVDIVAHSMGGLISRQYIQDFMATSTTGSPVVSNLLMMGTPNGGSEIANLIGSIPLGLVPAVPLLVSILQSGARELTTSFASIFNKKVTNTKNVPFSILSGIGTPLPFNLSDSNADGVVTVASTKAIPNQYQQTIALGHFSLPTEKSAFETFVLPLLSKDPIALGKSTNLALSSATVSTLGIETAPVTEQAIQPVKPLLQAFFGGYPEVPATGSVEVDISVPTGSKLEIDYIGANSVSATLIDPNGKTVQTIPAGTLNQGEFFRGFEVASPIVGNYKLRLEQQQGVKSNVQIAAGIVGSPISLDITVAAPDQNKQSQITATLVNGTAPVKDATVKGTITSSDGSTKVLTLLDDGKNGDGAAGDGVYGIKTDTLLPDDYLIGIAAQGQDFSRFASKNVLVPGGNKANVFIKQTNLVDTGTVGTSATYTFEVGDIGPSKATGVTLVDTLSADVDFVSASSGAIFDPTSRKVTFNLGEIASQSTVNATLVVNRKKTGAIGNLAVVRANEFDINLDDNQIDSTGAIANNAPVASKPLANASATQDKPFTLALPAGAFTDADAGDVLTYSATLANGAALPAWLKLDPATGTFTGTPTSTNIGSLQVKLTATDKANATANSVFALDVINSTVIVPKQSLTLQKSITDNVWNVSGAGKVQVSLLSKSTTQLNEIGIFKVDATNKVNGIAPGAAGFAKAVIESGSVVFTALSDRTTDGLTLSRSIQVNNGERLGFFLIANGSVEEDLKTNNFSNVTTSADLVNPYTTSPDQVPLQVKENQGLYTLDWKQGDKNLSFNFQVDPAPDTSLASISSQQGQKEGEVLDLRAFTGQNVQATFTLKREAGYNDSVSFYKIDDVAGTIISGSGQKFKPGDSGYVQAALKNAIAGLNLAGKNGQTVTVDKVLQGGSLYAPILMSNVTASRPIGENAFTAFSLGNADRTDHVRLLGGNTFGFEDLIGGGDKDFNDVIVQASFKTV